MRTVLCGYSVAGLYALAAIFLGQAAFGQEQPAIDKHGEGAVTKVEMFLDGEKQDPVAIDEESGGDTDHNGVLFVGGQKIKVKGYGKIKNTEDYPVRFDLKVSIYKVTHPSFSLGSPIINATTITLQPGETLGGEGEDEFTAELPEFTVPNPATSINRYFVSVELISWQVSGTQPNVDYLGGELLDESDTFAYYNDEYFKLAPVYEF